MTDALTPPRQRALPAPPPASRAISLLPWFLAAGWGSQAAIRLLLWWGRKNPLVLPDEAGYLLAARWLTGGPAADLSGFTFYKGGYSLLLTPAYLISDDPSVVYQLVRVTNALLGALVFPLGYLLLMRLGLRRLHACPLAWAAALLPACTLYNGLALVDAVLPVLVLGWLLLLDRFVRDGHPLACGGASLLAAYASAGHMRGLIVIAVHSIVLAAYASWRGTPWRTRRAALAGLGLTAAGYAAGALLNAQILDALYPTGQRDLTGILADRMTSLDGQLWAVSGGVGQVWAMICGTWGLAGLGLIVVTRTALSRDAAGADRTMSRVLLTTTAGVAYASSAALPNELRIGNFAYGRYLSCFALVYALIGLSVLMRTALTKSERMRGLFAATTALVGVTALWVRLYGGSRLDVYDFYAWDLPEVGLLGGSYDYFRPAVTSAVACLLLALLWGLSRWGGPKLFSALIVVNLCAALIAIVVARYSHESSPAPPFPGAATGRVLMERPRYGTDVRRPDPYKPTPEMIYLWQAYEIGWTRLEGFDKDRGLPGPGVCAAIVYWPAGIMAADTWPQRPAGWRYQRSGNAGRGLWWVVWYDPSCRR
ncbi:hypothetical protein GCM10010191_35720 [Actinomadura vinacea]|uniref:Glycosyltransferase RgtA/B/C/D-like domain-containing protein n=1 Tax=Actinomadura vinacea TaxID=115336 RepID=A0ABN3J4Y6_9ACTN